MVLVEILVGFFFVGFIWVFFVGFDGFSRDFSRVFFRRIYLGFYRRI
jgi:hypothetical protein